ncbi:hypothetical protein PHAVU_007G237500 [Phaseolus vulgaris]|uniref:Knottin scorpion toxin-like domain-containing protein n=1 Tax=Phaseolus vulgaris TaxID=3885 RepID=V7BK53_PHAVU|nr:hypothetical protein PHAVU_007G237500g [Phaseolus vulgaris]ESW17413.1 hypothetical protein PHAVU_007G237500g [Phaseolus vulgaris]
MSGYSVMWMILFKVAATIVLVISSGVRSQRHPPFCHETCNEFGDCAARCKVLGYIGGGKCIGTLCCCS